MKILCNLHPLGAGASAGTTRTGVFRVVDHLVRGLAAAPECEAAFHAPADLWPSWCYYEEHLHGARTRFAVAPWRVRASRHLVALERIVAAAGEKRDLPRRALRFGLRHYTATAGRLLARVDGRVLRSAQIYHSPFLPIATSIKRHRHLRRFTTIYDLIALSHPEFFNPAMGRLFRALVDGLDEQDYAICISQATRDTLLEHAPRLDPARVFVAPLAAGPLFYPERDAGRLAAVQQRLGLSPGAPYLMSLCTLEPRKNLAVVIRAFARLRREGQIDRQVRLLLAGTIGWKTESIFAALEEAEDCRQAITLTGFVPDADLAALYTGASAFVYMARAEGFGLPPLEAMQCGTPVITSNTSSLPEVVGDAGIQLAPDDLDGLCAALLSLLTDEARRRMLSERARQRAAGFSWERFVAQNLAAYRVALAA